MKTDGSNSLILVSRHTGERLELRQFQDDQGPWLELKGSLPPHREGPPLHVHFDEDEGGRVISGTLAALIGGEQLELNAGQELNLPRGVAHRWWNAGDELLTFEGFARPLVDLDRYLQAVFEVNNAGREGRPPLFYMAHALRRHRATQSVLVVPAAVQAILFPLVVGLGTLLGKYRGTDWPGCPARCTGALLVAEEEA